MPNKGSTMKKQVLFIQGGGAGTHDEWDNKLVDNLVQELGPGYDVRYPRMPNEADPSYATWKAALAQEFAGLNDGAILVGHSIGGTIRNCSPPLCPQCDGLTRARGLART